MQMNDVLEKAINMHETASLLVGLTTAVIAFCIAMTKGRSAGWFVLGFLFPVPAVFAVACLPKTAAREAAEREEREEEENKPQPARWWADTSGQEGMK